MLFESVDILGVTVVVSSVEQVARHVVELATSDGDGPSRYVCATSVHGIIESTEDPSFRSILNQAEVVAPDGMPLVWFSRLRGHPKAQRVYGPDLTLAVCRLGVAAGVRHFFYGGADGVPEELADALKSRYPGLQVAGTYSPPFRALTDAELRETADRINASSARVLWVGLSTPKQERWVHAVRHLLKVPVALTVGAAFDFHTGRVRQAPRWVGKTGLEWAFRLAVEPRRLWARYSYNNPRFLWLAVRQLVAARREQTEAR